MCIKEWIEGFLILTLRMCPKKFKKFIEKTPPQKKLSFKHLMVLFVSKLIFSGDHVEWILELRLERVLEGNILLNLVIYIF